MTAPDLSKLELGCDEAEYGRVGVHRVHRAEPDHIVAIAQAFLNAEIGRAHV